MSFAYRDRAKQLIDFDGLAIDGMKPTNIDAVIEYKDRLWIWLEYKREGASLPTGQRILYERLANDLGMYKPCIVIVAEHDTAAPQRGYTGEGSMGKRSVL